MSHVPCIVLVLFFGCAWTQETTTEYEADHTQTLIEEETSKQYEQTTAIVERKWVSQIFEEVQDAFRMHSNVSKRCREDYMMYETYLKNQTIWAVRMLESSEWPRLGLFSGATTVVGGWSECLSVRSPSYQGQYCLVDAVFDYSFVSADPIQRGWDRPANQKSSVWGVVKMYDTIIRRLSRRNVTWAMCIPSSCTAGDLQMSVMDAAVPIFRKYDMDIVAHVTPNTCRVEESKPHSKAFRFTLWFLLFLSAVVLLATYYDYKAHICVSSEPELQNTVQEESYALRVMYAFSAFESWKCLSNLSSSTVHSLYFAKSILCIMIIIAHEGFVAIPFPKLEQEQTELLYEPWEIFLGFHACVDVFVGISGFLTFHFGYEPTKKLGIVYFFGSIIFRWIRLMPVQGLLIMVYSFMVPELVDGPLWNKYMLYDVECCRSNWWTNMLALNNIVNRKDMCLPHTWYIAVDFQLTVLGAAILYIMSKNLTVGIISMIGTFLTGVGIHFFTIYINKFTGLPVPAVYHIENLRQVPVFSDLYIQIYSRIGPYMVGFAGAFLMRVLKKKKYHPSTLTCLLIILVTIFLGTGTMAYGFFFAILGRPYEPIENAAYGPITRTLIAVPVISIVLLHELRRMGWFSYVIESTLFLVVGRLVYVVYLTSFALQFARISSMRQLLVGTGHLDLTYGIMTDFCLTAICSVLLFALSEGPIHNLTMILLTDLDERKKKSDAYHMAIEQDQIKRPGYKDNFMELGSVSVMKRK